MQKAITHIHFWCTVAGVLLIVPFTSAGLVLFTIGAKSVPMCLIYGFYYAYNDTTALATFCVNWFWIYTIVYLTLYLLSQIKKRHALFGIALALDTAFRCIMVLLIQVFDDIFTLSTALFDAILGLAVCALFFYAGHIGKKRQKTTSGRDEVQ